MTILLWHVVSGSGDEGTRGRGELRDQTGAGSGEAAVQHCQREPRESTRYYQGAAATEGKRPAPRSVHNECGSNRNKHDMSNLIFAHICVCKKFCLTAEEVKLYSSIID